MTRRSLLCVLALAGSGRSTLALGSKRAGIEQRSLLDAWLWAVANHTAGVRDEALLLAEQWNESEVRTAVEYATSRSNVDLEGMLGPALLLHTDVATLSRSREGYALPDGSRSFATVEDGRVTGRMDASFHWEAGRRIARAASGTEGRTLCQHWWRAVGALLVEWAEYPEVRLHLHDVPGFLNRDSRLSLLRAIRHCAYALPRIQLASGVQSVLTTPMAQGSTPEFFLRHPVVDEDKVRPAPLELRDARTALRRSLETEAGLTEARVRLAHVLAELGDLRGARSELERGLAEAVDPGLRYYALMLSARVYTAEESFSPAQTALVQALALFPGSSAPRVALSHLVLLDTRGARETKVWREEGDGADPWWTIHRRTWPSASEQMASFVMLAQRRK